MEGAHKPNFRNEFNEWWREPRHPFFFYFSYRKGWLPDTALVPLLPMFLLLFLCIPVAAFLETPGPILAMIALTMLVNLIWLALRVGAHCRLPLIDIMLLSVPIVGMLWGNLPF